MLFMFFMVRKKVILCDLWFPSVLSVVRKLGCGPKEPPPYSHVDV